MTAAMRNRVVIGRLKAKPLLAGQLLFLLALAGLVAERLGDPGMRDGPAAMLGTLLFGNLFVTALMIAALTGAAYFHRRWRRRDAWITHDGARLYRGSESWPLPLIRDVVVETGALGLRSLRLVVDDDSEVTRELARIPLLADSPEAVRGGVMFAVSGVRGFPSGSPLN